MKAEAYLNTISFGGVGDAFIVSLKLLKLLHTKPVYSKINHLFVESNQKALDLMKDWFSKGWGNSNITFEFECDANYEYNFLNSKWPNKHHLNTSVSGQYKFPGDDNIVVDTCVFRPEGFPQTHDVVIQCSAGVNSNRKWKFDLKQLVSLLRNKNLDVAIVGSDPKYFDEKDEDNFVNKVGIKESAKIVDSAGVYIGLSGFHTYRSLCRGVPNIHFEESEEHNKHYISSAWEEFRYGIKYGTIQEIISGLRHWGINV